MLKALLECFWGKHDMVAALALEAMHSSTLIGHVDATHLACAPQECFRDEDDAVAALGLEAVSALCEADALDFFGAWRVVHAALPALPAPPRLAAAWVGLLAHSALDAAAHPEKSGAIISLLWAAMGHAHAAVPPVAMFRMH